MAQKNPVEDKIAPLVHFNGEIASENSSSISGKKRRREGAEQQKKRRRQTRRGLCELNLEEMFIIFANIYPMDLLNLARTCKSLRGILMHKSSLFLWKAALHQIKDLPPCPADLTEPEYTNLVFYARCQVCGKPAHTILWNMRRRYCPACRVERLSSVAAYGRFLYTAGVLQTDSCRVGRYSGKWVDKDQMESFLQDYLQSPNKTEFLDEKRKQCITVSLHAGECEYWQKKHGRVHRHDLELLRKERGSSIFRRLKQHGHEREIAYFGEERIKQANKAIFFKKHKALTDNEWDQMWPDWIKIMNDFRMERLRSTVYKLRRRSLVSEYNEYVQYRPSNAPTFDLLPHVAELARFSPFQEVIKAPEEAQMGVQPFASAFSQLPVLVDGWKKQLDIDVAGLVKIPSHLSLEDTGSSRTAACSRVSSAELHQTDVDKLRLACAVFHIGGRRLFTYPEVFFVKMHQNYPEHDEDTPECASPLGRLGVGALEEAPYIVHACGLDPNVATAGDMDRRNARLRCLSCELSFVFIRDWRSAMTHAIDSHYRMANLPPLSESPRWELISDEYIGAIQAAEESSRKFSSRCYAWCLLCQPRVGNVRESEQGIGHHLLDCHGVDTRDMKRGVHYEYLGLLNDYTCTVEMTEKEGEVVFKGSRY